MKISLNWAKHWTKIPAYDGESLENFSHTYSTYTAEVEGIDKYIFDDRIVVAKVLSWKPHPDSEKLGLVQVDAGENGEHEIVCGATNVATAHYVVLALENATLPNGLVIARRPIRGIDSCGMICSLDELGLQSARAEGIFPLETVWSENILSGYLGQPFGQLTLSFPGENGDVEYSMNDVVFDLDNKFITNRPDLFSVVGNAREIACIERENFSSLQKILEKGENTISVSIQTDKVLNYSLVEYRAEDFPVTPFVFQVLLMRSGQGLHGFLPDLANVVMTESGQPMHVFNADTVQGNITVRMAREGEKLLGLDDREYALTEEDIVIADDVSILALAGIIGSKHSATTDKTTHIFAESGTFHPVTVRKTSQRLGLRTDSSIRFEKGVDTQLPLSAQERFSALITYFSSAKQVGQFSHTAPYEVRTVEVEKKLIESKMGITITDEEMATILQRLGFSVQKTEEAYGVEIPSWRNTGDVTASHDIVEEIARHIGYETIPSVALPGPLGLAKIHSHDNVTQKITAFFAGKEYHDAYTYPFTLADRYDRFSSETASVIENTAENRTHLRAHLAESLLELVSKNYREHDNGAFFEFGSIFDGEEKLQGMGICWGEKTRTIQADLVAYMKTFFGTSGMILQGDSDTRLFAPRAHGEIVDDHGNVVIRFGLIKPTLLSLFDIEDNDVYGFEIVALPDIERKIHFSPLSEYPGTRREFNFIVPEEIPVAELIKQVSSVHEWISDITVPEIYRDVTHIGEDKKSIIISLLLRDPSTTITDEKAGEIQLSIIQSMEEKGYYLRKAS